MSLVNHTRTTSFPLISARRSSLDPLRLTPSPHPPKRRISLSPLPFLRKLRLPRFGSESNITRGEEYVRITSPPTDEAIAPSIPSSEVGKRASQIPVAVGNAQPHLVKHDTGVFPLPGPVDGVSTSQAAAQISDEISAGTATEPNTPLSDEPDSFDFDTVSISSSRQRTSGRAGASVPVSRSGSCAVLTEVEESDLRDHDGDGLPAPAPGLGLTSGTGTVPEPKSTLGLATVATPKKAIDTSHHRVWLCTPPPRSPTMAPASRESIDAPRKSSVRPQVIRAMSTGRLAHNFDDNGRVMCYSNHCERVWRPYAVSVSAGAGATASVRVISLSGHGEKDKVDSQGREQEQGLKRTHSVQVDNHPSLVGGMGIKRSVTSNGITSLLQGQGQDDRRRSLGAYRPKMW